MVSAIKVDQLPLFLGLYTYDYIATWCNSYSSVQERATWAVELFYVIIFLFITKSFQVKSSYEELNVYYSEAFML